MFEQEKPDFINDQGVKWWMDRVTTEYARKPNAAGKALLTAIAWKVEESNGKKSFLLTDGDKVLAESQQLEAIACKIDFLKLV
jgi:hypothetical protein